MRQLETRGQGERQDLGVSGLRGWLSHGKYEIPREARKIRRANIIERILLNSVHLNGGQNRGNQKKKTEQEKARGVKRNKSKPPWKLGDETGSRRERPGTGSFREDGGRKTERSQRLPTATKASLVT